jgi:hypothetical protein
MVCDALYQAVIIEQFKTVLTIDPIQTTEQTTIVFQEEFKEPSIWHLILHPGHLDLENLIGFFGLICRTNLVDIRIWALTQMHTRLAIDARPSTC